VTALLTQTTGWWSGVLHPVQDVEPLFTMLLVGVLAGLCTASGRSAWWAPITFVTGLAAGALIGATGIVPDVRRLLIGLVVVLAGLLFAHARVARPLPLIGLAVGVLQGLAHGSLVADSARPGQYLAGTLFTACIVVAFGALVGLSVARVVVDRRTLTGVVPTGAVAPRPVAGRRAA
jgi:hydrogenase/urease accessory protein HupE